MSAFTPRPWVVIKCRCGHRACRYYGTNNGSFPQGAGYSLEDARLIAAGPDLYEALRWFAIRQDAIQALFDLHGPKDTADAMRENFKAARAALSEVKG